jgi:transposase
MNRHELTDEQWARVEPLLPPMRSGWRDRPYHDHRCILNGLLWLLTLPTP